MWKAITITVLALICMLAFACPKEECAQFEGSKQGRTFSAELRKTSENYIGKITLLRVHQDYTHILRCLEYPYVGEIVLLKESPFSDKDTSFVRIYPSYESIFDTTFNKPIQFGKTTINFILVEPER